MAVFSKEERIGQFSFLFYPPPSLLKGWRIVWRREIPWLCPGPNAHSQDAPSSTSALSLCSARSGDPGPAAAPCAGCRQQCSRYYSLSCLLSLSILRVTPSQYCRGFLTRSLSRDCRIPEEEGGGRTTQPDPLPPFILWLAGPGWGKSMAEWPPLTSQFLCSLGTSLSPVTGEVRDFHPFRGERWLSWWRPLHFSASACSLM